MNKDNIEDMLGNLKVPESRNITHQQELKIPLLRYRKTSIAGLWLILPPLVFALTAILKYEVYIVSPFLDRILHFFKSIDNNNVLTYLIPLIFVGLPLVAMVTNLLAFCHFAKGRKELLITVKYRPFNIAIFLLSFALLVYAFLPDALP